MISEVRGWSSPSRYIQGSNICSDLYTYCSCLGNKPLVLLTPSCQKLVKHISDSYEHNGAECLIELHRSNGSINEINYYAEMQGFDYIIGIGGGKIIDLTKAIADEKSIPCVVIPSIISSDAPATSRSVIYNDDGSSFARKYDKAPDLIIVDLNLICGAPVRYFVSGIGDAIATKFEADANVRFGRKNFIKGNYISTETGNVISDHCFNVLITESAEAVSSLKNGTVNKSLERVSEAVILMSGLGSENCGCGIAHSIGEGIALISGSKTLHGEQVAFGLICQLLAEKRSNNILDEVINLYKKIGLPIKLNDLHVENNKESLDIIANMAFSRACWYEALETPVNYIGEVVEIIRQADMIGN